MNKGTDGCFLKGEYIKADIAYSDQILESADKVPYGNSQMEDIEYIEPEEGEDDIKGDGHLISNYLLNLQMCTFDYDYDK